MSCFAAYAHEGLSSFSPTLICNNNVTGSVSVFTAAIKNKIKRIILFLYGNDMEIFKYPLKKMIKNPVDPYGVSKVANLKYFKNFKQDSWHRIQYAVVYIICIGPKQKVI